MESRRVTQLDVARAAGVHRSSVSMALRNHPNIPPETRERIQKAAKQLGYVADPMLSALAYYRSRVRPPEFRGTIAWVVDNVPGYNWRHRPHFVQYHAGALQRAKQHGYALETFDLAKPGFSIERIADVVLNRGVQGVLLCPQPRPNTVLPIPLDNLSAVTFGYSISDPQLHTVTATHYRATLQTMRELLSRGYKRIGLVVSEDHDQKTEYNYQAGYRVGMGDLPQLPILSTNYTEPDFLKSWLKKHKPEVIITANHRILEDLQSMGVRVPQDVAVACVCLPDRHPVLSGVVENNRRIGTAAVDFLVSLIQRGERGVPESAERVHVEGRWSEGTSLRPKPPVRT